MTDFTVTIQVNPESVPSLPCWLAEGAAFAQVLISTGILKAIEERVQFARARLGHYERLLPFADAFMALFGRHHLPSRSALSRFLAALDQATVERLRTLFQEDLVKRPPAFHFPRWLIRSTGQPLGGDGCRCHQASRTSTSAAPTQVAPGPPSSPEPGL